MKIEFIPTGDPTRTVCQIRVKDKYFYGEAQCHPQDEDYCSIRTGQTISESRARIKYYQYLKNEERTKLHALYEVRHRFRLINVLSREYITISNFIKEHEEILAELICAIEEEKKFLKDYIDLKDELYKRYRKNKGE